MNKDLFFIYISETKYPENTLYILLEMLTYIVSTHFYYINREQLTALM